MVVISSNVSSTPGLKKALDEWKKFCERVQSSNAVDAFESSKTQEERIKRGLSDYNFFVRKYFSVYADCDCADFHVKAANAILKDPTIWAILEWAREHAKSVHATVIIPMWLLAHGQLTGMILMGKNEADACNLLSDVQAQLQFNELFIHDFGEQFNFGDWQDGDFTTKGGVRFMAVGRDQSPRGARKNEKRPNYAVIDDVDDDEIVNNQRRVLEVVKRIKGALYGALSIKGARMVVAGNRIHPQSVLAHMVGDIKIGMPKNPEVFHSKVCATDGGYCKGKPSWHQRYTLEQLTDKMRKMGIIQSKVEYYHEHHIEGKIFKDQYIKWQKIPKLKDMTVIIGYFDPSFENKATSDFKAIRVWGLHKETKVCIKSFVRRCELTEAFMWMINYEKSLPEGIKPIWYVEQQFYNRPVREALEQVIKLTGHRLLVITDTRTKENKYTRIVRMEPDYSLGNVIFNIEEVHNSDMIEGNNQLKGIEPGYRSPDDAPDADEGAWYFLNQHLQLLTFKPVIGRRTKGGW